MSSMHFYTTDPNEPVAGWQAEGVTGFVYGSEQPGTAGLYRWRQPDSNLHFYTVDPAGEAAPTLGYVLERIECYVPNDGRAGTVPTYRWYNSNTGDHLYTSDANGELGPVSGYVHEGIAFYAFPSQLKGTIPLFRWVNGDQTWCIRLSKGTQVVFSKNYHVGSFEEAKALSQQALLEYNAIQVRNGMPTADRAEVPKAGGC